MTMNARVARRVMGAKKGNKRVTRDTDEAGNPGVNPLVGQSGATRWGEVGIAGGEKWVSPVWKREDR